MLASPHLTQPKYTLTLRSILRFATMSSHSYYESDLAWVHHVGYWHHAERTGPGVVALLRERGLALGASVLDVGCGSGLLARQLRAAGFAVRGVDASPAMIELARDYEPSAKFDVVRLPTSLHPGKAGALPDSDAVVSTGHVLNYLDTRAQNLRGTERVGPSGSAGRPARD